MREQARYRCHGQLLRLHCSYQDFTRPSLIGISTSRYTATPFRLQTAILSLELATMTKYCSRCACAKEEVEFIARSGAIRKTCNYCRVRMISPFCLAANTHCFRPKIIPRNARHGLQAVHNARHRRSRRARLQRQQPEPQSQPLAHSLPPSPPS